MKFSYSQVYFPPAPVMMVSLAVMDGSPQTELSPALIDTGADGTFVPTEILEYLDVPGVYSTNVRSHLSANPRRVTVHKVDLVFDATRLPGVEVVSDDLGNEIIIGRNVLNKLQLFLNGPGQITEIK